MQVSNQMVLESGRLLKAADAASEEGFWERAALLRAEERVLVELAVRGGRSHRQIARLLGRTPGSVTRALQRLGRRLSDPLVLALLHPNCLLEPQERQIGVEYFLCDLTAKQLAAKHQLPEVQVRRILHALKAWHRGAAAAAGEQRRNGTHLIAPPAAAAARRGRKSNM
jgi:hypothetical protein